MGAPQVNQLLADLTGLYVSAGYIAARPYLVSPPADGHSLDVFIEEGFVEAIELDDPSLPVSLASAFGELMGEPLQLRLLERGLDQINRLQAFDVTADIEPGESPGGSRLLIRSKGRKPRGAMTLLLDNRGSSSTGQARATLSAGLDSPLELNDQLTLAMMRSYTEGPGESQSLGLSYAIPWGAWTLGAAASRFDYASEARTPTGQVRFEGKAQLLGLNLDRTLWRSRQGILGGSLRLNRKGFENLTDRARPTNQNPRYDTAEVALNFTWLDAANWGLAIGYVEGLGGWGADDGHPIKDPRSAEGRFHKWRLNANQTRPLAVGPLRSLWVSQVAGQYSKDPLPSPERMSLTSDGGVRGFRNRLLTAERGVTWSNALLFPFALTPSLTAAPRLGLDLGWADATYKQQGQRLAGVNAGIAFSFHSLQMDLEYQRSVYLQRDGREPAFWRLDFRVPL